MQEVVLGLIWAISCAPTSAALVWYEFISDPGAMERVIADTYYEQFWTTPA